MDLAAYLTSIDGTLYYYPNPGNAGDSLIASATYQLFRKNNIDIRLITSRRRFDAKGKIAVYGGGGNFGSDRVGAAPFVKQYHRDAKRLVVLPHTVNGCETLLAELGPNVDIICRELTTYHHVAKHATRANVYLADDVAFGMDISEILKAVPRPAFPLELLRKLYYRMLRDARAEEAISLRATYLSAIFRLSELTKGRKDFRILHCFRTDRERTNISIPPGNLDLSKIFAFGTSDVVTASHAAHCLIRIVNRCETLHTNRLHIAIAGALLGKHVMMYPNNYHKCRSVYEFSMRERFPNVCWVE